MREAIKEENAQLLVVAAQTESEIAELDTYEERQEFLAEIGLQESGVARLIRAAYALLNLQTFFTAGSDEVRAWTFMRGSKAPQCAGIIHTDFEKGFIRAEVIKYDDLCGPGRRHNALPLQCVNKIHKDKSLFGDFCPYYILSYLNHKSYIT